MDVVLLPQLLHGESTSASEERVSTQVQTKTTHERRKHGDSQRDMSRVG